MLRAAGDPDKTEGNLRKKGLEPLRPFGHQLLRLARLPIPPLPRWNQEYNIADSSVNASDRQYRMRLRVRFSLGFASTSLVDLSLTVLALPFWRGWPAGAA